MEIDSAIRDCSDRRLQTKYQNATYVIQRAFSLYECKANEPGFVGPTSRHLPKRRFASHNYRLPTIQNDKKEDLGEGEEGGRSLALLIRLGRCGSTSLFRKEVFRARLSSALFVVVVRFRCFARGEEIARVASLLPSLLFDVLASREGRLHASLFGSFVAVRLHFAGGGDCVSRFFSFSFAVRLRSLREEIARSLLPFLCCCSTFALQELERLHGSFFGSFVVVRFRQSAGGERLQGSPLGPFIVDSTSLPNRR
ncbi:hypothetical protein IEQ34_010189 [Dendrobium chrysotoxum]|uniref:Uncharacterized protein n=1 Tax=Dendrobium chrysotoxum TaxID=161865 RepID=A0AAV7GLF9_DENCH|nr:hypothetical protein IEQ34_010189 [Dendrobium chrysotoxum]